MSRAEVEVLGIAAGLRRRRRASWARSSSAPHGAARCGPPLVAVAVVSVLVRRRGRGRHRPAPCSSPATTSASCCRSALVAGAVGLVVALVLCGRGRSATWSGVRRAARDRLGERSAPPGAGGGVGVRELAEVDDELPRRRRPAGGGGPARAGAGGVPPGARSPGSATTCARRWPACGRWPRRSRTGWPPTPPATTGRSAARWTGSPGWSTTCSSCPGSSPARSPSALERRRPARAGRRRRRRRRRPMAEAGGVRGSVRRRPAAGPRRCAGTPASSARVLANLVVNAIRHTPSDGTVRGQRPGGGRGVRARASATAAGALDDERSSASSTPGGAARRPARPGPDGGAGLGLAIARGIVEAHAGRDRRANTARGCRFEVRLPRADALPG